MDKTFTGILQKLITEQGKEALLNPSKCKAFLADYTSGEYKKENRLLLQALDAGVVKEIDGAEDIAFCKKQQAAVLQEECFLQPEIAAGLVDTLALLLRGDTTRTHSKTPPIAPQPMPTTSPPKKCSKRKALIAVAAGVVLLAGVALSLYAYNDALIQKEIRIGASFRSYMESGEAYYEKRDYERAIEDFEAALRISPNRSSAIEGLEKARQARSR